MTTTSPYQQRQLDAHFEQDITQHSADLSFSSEMMILTIDSTLNAFSSIRKSISSGAVLRHRNELARTFNQALRKHPDWSNHSQQAAEVVDWLLSLKKGRDIGGYLRAIRPMVDLACTRLSVPLEQKHTWKQAIAPAPAYCPKDIGLQAVNAFPRPILHDVFTR